MTPTRTGVHPPQQRRSRESLERVLAAGETLLATEGFEGFTIAAVSKRAKVSVGSVYGRFENKDALIYAIHRRMLGRLSHDDVLVAMDRPELTLSKMVDMGVHAMADGLWRERALLRVFMLRAPIDPKIADAGSASSRAISRAFTSALLSRRPEFNHPKPELAADVAFRVVYDLLARRIMYGSRFESELEIGWDDLVNEASCAAIAYLRFTGR